MPKRGATFGRPSTLTERLAATLCERLSEGASLRSICAQPDMPSLSTVFRWLQDERNEAFRDQYTRAREAQGMGFADEIVEIADTARCKDSAAAAKVRIDARKWTAARQAAKVYGDKIEQKIEHSGGLTVEILRLTDAAPHSTGA